MKKLFTLLAAALTLFAVNNATQAQIKTETGSYLASYHGIPVSSRAFSGYIAFELTCEKSNDAEQYSIHVSENLKSAQPTSLLSFNYSIPVQVILSKSEGSETLTFTQDNSTLYPQEKAIKYNLDLETKSKLQNITEKKFLIPMHNGMLVTFNLPKNVVEEWNQVLAAEI